MPFSVLFIIQKVIYADIFKFPQSGHDNELERLTISAKSMRDVKQTAAKLKAKHANQDACIKVRVVHGKPPKTFSAWLRKSEGDLYIRAPEPAQEVT